MSKEMFLSEIVHTEKMMNNKACVEEDSSDLQLDEKARAKQLQENTRQFLSENSAVQGRLKERLDVSIRKEWVKKAREEYPDKIPIVIEAHDEKMACMKNPKFLMPKSFRINEVAVIIRKKLELSRNDALVLYVERGKKNAFKLLAGEAPLANVYADFRDPDDDLLYFVYAQEQVYG